MVHVTINDNQTEAAADSTVLAAAEKLGISIPTLCHKNGYKPNTSCMICVVHELKTDSLILSCSQPVAEGMLIETDNERVHEARKDTLDLLLSEHVGDCEAPCLRGCPAKMNIPLMIRQIKENQLEEAIITVKKDIALPAVLGRICPAPCEKVCNRRLYDDPISICSLKRFAADTDLAKETPYRPKIRQDSGKKIVIIGSGPAGLAAAYYLAQFGHACCIFDRNIEPGGQLRYDVLDEKLPKSVLDDDIEQIRALGVELMMDKTLGKDFSVRELTDDYDALVLAFGKTDRSSFNDTKIECSPRGIVVNRNTCETSIPGVFAGGNAVSESKMAILSIAHGKTIAWSVDQFLSSGDVIGIIPRFNSMLGKLYDSETDEFIKEAETYNRIESAGGFAAGYDSGEAVAESRRCFHCDCRKTESCKLRRYSDYYEADQKRFCFGRRKSFQRIVQHDVVSFEPGKCIKCNLCIEITKKAGEKLGFTFIGRGFDVQIEVPFNESLNDGLQKTAKECVESCPTAAIAWRTGEEGEESGST